MKKFMAILKKNKFSKKKAFLKDSSLGFAFGAFLVLGIFIFSLYSFAAWNNPTAAPPGNNVPEPINTGTSAQNKMGTFKLGSTTPTAYPADFFVYNGGASIGTTSVAAKTLTVENQTSVAANFGGGYARGVENPFDGSDAVNKAWAEGRYALASANFWADRGSNNISNTNTGNVGIGTISPSQQLEITKNFQMPNTTHANQYGIIYKNGNRFLHDFNYGDNGTVTTAGGNLFLGEN
ncbi:MAG: hypothetical protein PHO56_00005, partial [Patescibacteria group bacterium]|nr:hypothetical protein [Patescibacteria group bacterium]